MKVCRCIVLLLCLSWVPIPVAAAEEERPEQEGRPLDLDLLERTERRLVQLDVSIRPKKKFAGEQPPELGAEDLELRVGGRPIALSYADRICRSVPVFREPAAEPSEPRPPEMEDPPLPRGRGTFVFYLEHKHLTIEGQATALTMAEELIPELVAGGNRGMVVSSGRKLLQSELTDDPRKLLEFLSSVRKDTRQWTEATYAEAERDRILEIMGADLIEAVTLAGQYHREEIAATNRHLRRFAATLGALADFDPPKAVLYFADIIRSNAGGHYRTLFGANLPFGLDFKASTMETASGMATHAFHRVTEQAGAHGVRLYTIQARGLQALGPYPDTARRDAEMTMAGFALETGGETFLGGTDRQTLATVANRIHSDLNCFYLLSFHPDDLGRDRTLPVRVRFNRNSERHAVLDERYEIRSRGQIVIQSETARKESVLLAAHVASGAVDSSSGRGVLIPLAYKDGRFRALVQFMVANPELPAGLTSAVAWELGMTHVDREKVRQQASGMVEVNDPRAPVVLEAEWEFAPGPSEIVSVAYENQFGQLVTLDLDPDWPDPNAGKAVVTSLAVLQPTEAVFVREAGEDDSPHRFEGSLGIGEGFARNDRPTYMVGLVCRSKGNKKDLWIDRKLVGLAPVDFELQKWEYDGERCVQIRDLIHEGAMGVTEWGEFSYRVTVHDDEDLLARPLAQAEREFVVVDAGLAVIDRDSQQVPRNVDPLQVLPALQ